MKHFSHRSTHFAAAFFLMTALFLFLSACGFAPARAEEAAETPSPAPTPAETAAPVPTATPTPTPTPAPRIELIDGAEIEQLCGRPFADPGYKAFDADGSDRTDCVRVSGEVTCWKVGSYELRYTLTVEEQTLAECIRTVRVVPNTLPETVPTEKVIYLTFDDGPCENTPELLDVLAKYDAKATFFIVGNRDEDELAILPRIAEEGHALGVHAYWHQYGHIYQSQKNFFEDFMAAQEVIYRYTGSYATLSRFPGSTRTASGLKADLDNGYETLTQMMHDMGVRFYDWSVQIEDKQNGAEGTFINFKIGVPKADIPIVLQHDTRYYSVRAVEKMLQWGLENGYTFKALDTTVPEIHFFREG